MNYDIAIIGGGIVGSALACALSGKGLSIALVDAQAFTPPASVDDNDTWALRVSALTPASKQWLESLSVWQRIPTSRLCAYDKMHVWESDSHPSTASFSSSQTNAIHFDSSELGLHALGYIVENIQLQHALYTRMAECADITQLCPAQLKEITLRTQSLRVTLEGQPDIDAKLVIGADGRASKVRQLSAIDVSHRDYQEQAIVATVTTEKPHQNTAWQRFLPTGPLAFLPLPNPQQVSIVWSAQTHEAKRLFALDSERFSRELNNAIEQRLGRVELHSQRAMFPLARQHAHRYIAERIALVGDAAHTVHPLAGQGLNMGLNDAAFLAQNIAHNYRHKKDYWCEHRLRRYERQCKSENTLMIGVCEGLRHLFLSENACIAHLRRTGIDVAQNFSPLKRQMIDYATRRTLVYP